MLAAAATSLLVTSGVTSFAFPAIEESLVGQQSDVARTIRERGTHSGNPVSPIDLRVVPAMGNRQTSTPASLVRLSVITNVTAPLKSEGG